MANTVLHSDLTDEQVAKIQLRLKAGATTDQFWDAYCSKESWSKGSKTMKVRKLVKPTIAIADVQPLTEGVAPDPTKLSYTTFEYGVENYGDYIEYTKEDVLFNIDDVVRDAGDTLAYKWVQTLDIIKGGAFLKTKCSITAGATVSDTMAKARIILIKNHGKAVNGGNFLFICAPEVGQKLLKEVKDEITHTSQKEGIIKGYLGSYMGFDIVEDATIVLNKDGTTQYGLFIAKNVEGKFPVVSTNITETDVIRNSLGSGVVADSAGKVVSDHNHQIGSVAVNGDGLGAYITDDECILLCEFAEAKVENTIPAETARSGYVSTSKSPV